LPDIDDQDTCVKRDPADVYSQQYISQC